MNQKARSTTLGRPVRPQRGFTLVELLVVIAIITLLISILVPALSRARDSAKRLKTRAMMKAAGDGLELLRDEAESEFSNGYPSSQSGDDPTEADVGLQISGAQLLVRYLMGKDFNGYVSTRSTARSYPGPSGWEQKGWYDSPGDPDFPAGATEPFQRTGPYLTPDAARIMAPRDLPGGNPSLDSPQERNPVMVDPYNMPILYYAANAMQAAQAKPNIATANWYPGSTQYPGIYNFSDNVLFTGGCACLPATGTCLCIPARDYGNSTSTKFEDWPTTWLGSTPPVWSTVMADQAVRGTFAYYIMDKNIFDMTSGRSVIPHRKDTYLLLSPGKDGQFRTADDVTNFD